VFCDLSEGEKFFRRAGKDKGDKETAYRSETTRRTIVTGQRNNIDGD
jgi:hypothetical protein